MKVVSSPPYEGSFDGRSENPDTTRERMRKAGHDERIIAKVGDHAHSAGIGYGDTVGQMGNSQGDDFWTAARQIMYQVAQLLPPDAVAVWVVKGFIRDKAYVDFPNQWRALGESCGFETTEWIRAWLIEDKGEQYNLFGELERKTIERKSFFRRLAERNGSPRIDYEVVLIQRRLPLFEGIETCP